MEDMIYSFFLSHGWKLTLIAVSGILFLGVLKTLNVFNKIDKEKRKYIYAAISAGFSIAASGIYLAIIGGFEWSTFGILSAGILGVNQAAYAIYETYGVRALFRKIGSLLLKAMNSKGTTAQIETATEQKKEEKEPIDDLAKTETIMKQEIKNEQPESVL